MTAAELYNEYKRFVERFAEEPMSQRTLGMRLKERGFVQTRTGKARFWHGLKLLDPLSADGSLLSACAVTHDGW